MQPWCQPLRDILGTPMDGNKLWRHCIVRFAITSMRNVEITITNELCIGVILPFFLEETSEVVLE